MFSSSGAGGAAPQPGPPPPAGHPHLAQRTTYGAQGHPQQHYAQQNHQQPYPAQQYTHHQPRTVSGPQPGAVGAGAPPPGSLAQGAGGPHLAYPAEQQSQGYGAPQPQGAGAGVPAGYAPGPSPHMVPRTAPPPQQQQQQGVRYAPTQQPQQHQLGPAQLAYGYGPPQPARSPAPPVQPQDRYAASPTTYAPPHPIPSPRPHPGPSPHPHPQRIPSTSHPFPPPQRAHPYGPPTPAPQPIPSPSRSAQHLSSHPSAAAPPGYAPHSRQASYPQPGSAPAPPPPHPSRGVEHAAGSALPPSSNASSAALHAQAQGQAQAHAQLELQALTARGEQRSRESRHAFYQARMARKEAAVREGALEDEADEVDVVPASRPLRTVGNGYVAAPVQPPPPTQQQMMGAQPPRVTAQHDQARFMQPMELPGEDEQRTQFHAYLLDYLQKAGFLSAAAALLAEAPSIPTHPLSSGRSFAVPSSSPSSQPPSATSATFPHLSQQQQHNPLFFTSPSALSPIPLAPAPPRPRSAGENDSPHRRADGSPVSPLSSQGGDGADGKNGGDTVGSTASTASTTSHFGFDALHGGHGGDGGGGEGASPAKGDTPRSPAKRTAPAPQSSSSRHVSGSSTGTSASVAGGGEQRIPAAQVQIDAPTGFLFEWWAVFWDVFRAQAASRRPNAAENAANARSFCQASSAAVEAAMLRQASMARAQGPAPPPPQQGRPPSAGGPQRAGPPQGLQPQMQQRAYAPPQAQMHPQMQMQQLPAPLTAPPMPLPFPSPVAPGAGGGVPARQPIPLRTTPLPNHAQPQAGQRSVSVQPSRANARRGAIPPDALPDEALPPPGPASGTRRASSTRAAQAHHLAQQRQQEQQAELNARMAQARVHAQQITHRQRSHTGSEVGGTPEAGGGLSPPGGGASPNKTGATPPVSSFSPNALNYRPEQLQHAAEARNAYRARLVASQQSQLEQAKRAASSSRRPSAAGAEGSMPPPPAGKRAARSTSHTPQGKELALGPSPAGEQAPTPAATETDAPMPGGPGAAAGKRRRESLAESVSESREKKRATRPNDRPSSGKGATPVAQNGATPVPSGLPGVSEDVAVVSTHDFASTPADSSARTPAPPQPQPGSTESDFVVGELEGLDPSFAGAMAFDSHAIGFEPQGPEGQFSLEQLDALLSSTVDAAGTGFPPSDVGGGADASFNYDDFMNSFGNDGPASYDPTVQAFDLAV